MMENKQSYPTIKDFVLQEAHQKAFEKHIMGLKQFQKEKTKIAYEKKIILHDQIEKKHKDNNALRRINKSTKINQSRMNKMNARQDNIKQLIISTQQRLAAIIIRNESAYRQFMKKLIVQGLIKLMEPIVYVRCLKRDKNLVCSLLAQCKDQFKNLLQREGIDSSFGQIELKFDERYHLQERIVGVDKERVHKSDQSLICFGGVIMTNEDGLITCKNTIDTRLQLAYQQMLPTIRKNLYDQ